MVPHGSHMRRPIALRHPYVFYIGHVAAFLDACLGAAGLGCVDMELSEVCARGIDPDLDDPSKCENDGRCELRTQLDV